MLSPNLLINPDFSVASLLGLVKFAIIVGAVFYTLFLAVVLRQTFLLGDMIKTKASLVLNMLSFLNFSLGILLILMSFVYL